MSTLGVGMRIVTGSTNQTAYVDTTGGLVSYLCREGHRHTGDYALTDLQHCECPHDAPLWPVPSHRPQDGHFICSDCGKDFFVVEGDGGALPHDGITAEPIDGGN